MRCIIFLYILLPAVLSVDLDYKNLADYAKKWQKGRSKPIKCTVHLIGWNNNPPYFYQSDVPGDSEHDKEIWITTTGIIPEILTRILHKTEHWSKEKLNVKYAYEIQNETFSFTTEQELIDLVSDRDVKRPLNTFNVSASSNEVFILAGTTFYTENEKLYKRMKIVTTENSVIIVRTKDILLLHRFFNGIWKCKGVIFFAVTCAVNLAAVIWVIERQSNMGFEKTFGAGLWTSFWYCFVTMTTVGYGDKVPKHFISRFLCLAWMLFGLMLTAIITTTIMEAVQEEFPKVGKRIAVKNDSTQQAVLTTKISAFPVPYQTAEEVLEAVRREEVDAGFLDSPVAAYLFKEHKIEDLKIESRFLVKSWVFGYVFQAVWDECSAFFLNQTLPEDTMSSYKSIFVPTYHIKHYYARDFLEFFITSNDEGLVYYMTIFAAILIFLGVLTELLIKLNNWYQVRQQYGGNCMTATMIRRQRLRSDRESLLQKEAEDEIMKELETEVFDKIQELKERLMQVNNHEQIIIGKETQA
ncbi:uncharacterized protein [Clytia hemisphaerica]|uniref:Potassium channel domain-containing protein n=1 Tax=Clytia hemisphaerica TaxID=252671 RepID=A0A7M5UXT4_9CNID